MESSVQKQLRLHYNFYSPKYRGMDDKEKGVFIDKAIKFKKKHGYIPEAWELNS